MDSSQTPPDAPASPPHSPSEQVRRAHLPYELHAKSAGTLFILLGGFLIYSVWAYISKLHQFFPKAPIPIQAGGMFVFAASLVMAGFFIRTLIGWSRYLGLGLSAMGLAISLTPPLTYLGLVVYGFNFVLLLLPRTRTVFTNQYARVIHETPHVKRKPTLATMAVMVVLLVLLIVAIMLDAGRPPQKLR
jgi:hypothetical protein